MINTSIFRCLLPFLGTIFCCSCYNYGNIHEPYTNPPKVHNLPPPPEKIVGAPVSKKEYMQKTYTEIKNNLEEADVEMIEDSIKVLFPENIVYKSKDELPSSDYLTPLEKFATLLKKYYKTNILITGHSDNKGREDSNKKLSATRALNIRNVIAGFGIPIVRLTCWGLGSLSPIADNLTQEGRDKNRRVEFVVLYREK